MDANIVDRFRIPGRNAIVTGASIGLGAAIARGLAGAGANVAMIARRMDCLAALAAECPGSVPIRCDLSSAADTDNAADMAITSLGTVDILVNVAGALAGVIPAADEAVADVDATFRLNVIAPFQLCQRVHASMQGNGGGAIVNISSISGIVGIPGIPQASYAASKRALSGLATELAVQWGPEGIRVNTIAAGFFRSDMTEAIYASASGRAWLRKNTLLPCDGEPDDVVGAVLWLVSDAGRYVTGQTIVVDGGWTSQ